MDETLKNFLHDYLVFLWEGAQEAQAKWRHARAGGSAEDRAIQWGRALAYYEVLSTLKNDAQVWKIEDLFPGLKDIDPDQLMGRVH